MANLLDVSPKVLSKYPYGIAYVSAVDGRGNFTVFGIFKERKRTQTRRTYKFAGILCSVGTPGKPCGGKVQDGFIKTAVNETELKTFIQSYILLANQRVPLVKAPAEDIAKFLLSSFLKNHAAEEMSADVKHVVSLFSRAGKFAAHESDEDYMKNKLGVDLGKTTFAHLDRRRKELFSWWIEVPELMRIRCPQPEKAPGEMTNQEQHFAKRDDEWRTQLAKKLSTGNNYDRFSGMARHMAFWYLFADVQHKHKLAFTFMAAHRDILQALQNGKHLSPQNPILGAILDLTRVKCDEFGVCKGQKRTEFSLTSTRKSCNVCNLPGVPMDQSQSRITCCDKLGRGKLGDKIIQKVLGDLIFNYWEVSIPDDVMFPIRYALSKALHCFFAHVFNNLYWGVKPSIAAMNNMVRSLLVAVTDTLKSDSTKKAKKPDELLSVKPIKDAFLEILKGHCVKKLSEKELLSICRLFVAGYEDCFVLGESCGSEPDTSKSVNVFEGCEAKVEWIHNLVVAPSVAEHVKYTWQLLGFDARERLLACGKGVLNHVILTTYKATMGIIVRMRSKENAPKKGYLFECNNQSCACHNLSTFQLHFQSSVPTVFKSMKSHLVYRPDGYDENKGTLMLNPELYMDEGGDAVRDVVSGASDNTIYQTFADRCKVFKECRRLQSLCEATYKRLYLALKMKIVQEYREIPLLPGYNATNVDYYRDTCGGCGWEENGPDRFERCGGCMEACYCSTECQRHHWKAGHKDACSRVFMERKKKKLVISV